MWLALVWHTKRARPAERPATNIGPGQGGRVQNEVVSTLGDKSFADPAATAVAGRILPPVLEIDDLHVQFVTSHGTVRAVEGLSYSVRPGEMVALVGLSGAGKTTVASLITRLHEVTS